MQRSRMTTLGYSLAVAAVGLIGAGAALAKDGEGGKSAEREARRTSAEGEARRGEARDGDRARGPRDREQAGDRGEEARGRQMIRALFRDIELTDSQKEEVRGVLEQARDERRAWLEENGEQLRELRERFQDARAINDVDAMQSIGQEVRTLMSAGPEPMAVAEDVRGVLDESQAEQFDANLERVRERIDQARERRRGDRGEGGDSAEAREGRRGSAEAREGRGDSAEARERRGRAERAGDGDGVNRAAIEERLRRFRERREAKAEDGPPKMDDSMFSDETGDAAATQPKEKEADKQPRESDGDQLDL